MTDAAGPDQAETESDQLGRLARMFAHAPEFDTSPLYTELAATVADTPALLRLAALARPGQYPTFAFFGAIQAVLLSGADHELALFYRSASGATPDASPAPASAASPGAALIDFVAHHEDEIAQLIKTRLVQTNIVKRSLALRIGLATIARTLNKPVHLIEVGASAGILLRFHRYGYHLGGRRFGDPDSPVQISALWHSSAPVPDLDVLPPLASTTGIDLNPLNAADPADRHWLEALVFPENRHQADLLHNALDAVAADPPVIHRGDAIDLCQVLARQLPPDEPRVVFHAVTRLHVPKDRRPAFDAAIDSLGEDAPLYRLSLEVPPDPDPRPQPVRPGIALTLREPDGRSTDLIVAEGRLEWVEPLAWSST
jgi:hypothetical protein